MGRRLAILKRNYRTAANMDPLKNELDNKIKDELPCCIEQEHKPKKIWAKISTANENRFLGVCILIAAVMVSSTWAYTSTVENTGRTKVDGWTIAKLEKTVLPEKGVSLPVKWGSLGKKLVETGIIDRHKFESLYSQRGGLDEETIKLLSEDYGSKVIITKENASILLNLLWAVGLSNKNEVLENGPMTDKNYGGAGNFASTGGWTLAAGNPMDHYSKHAMITLTPAQQALVKEVSGNIYRPCCGNSTYFPDCNHGMAMLGFLELMASQGVAESDMYEAALAVNSYWFPDTYLNIAQFLESKGMSWKDVLPKAILSAEYSSAAGYQQVLKQIEPATQGKGGSCGV